MTDITAKLRLVSARWPLLAQAETVRVELSAGAATPLSQTRLFSTW